MRYEENLRSNYNINAQVKNKSDEIVLCVTRSITVKIARVNKLF
jgi:hypothetical protein